MRQYNILILKLIELSLDRVYVRGLRDVAACETKISFVDPYGALYYSGYEKRTGDGESAR